MKKINNTIEDSYCSFEVSKLLKEKGFDIRTTKFYYDNKNNRESEGYGENLDSVGIYYWKPTHAIAIEWLRINFGLHINSSFPVRTDYDKIFYSFLIYKQDEIGIGLVKQGNEFNSPQEATESALLYCLKNLIKI